jgi:hypothetical protein
VSLHSLSAAVKASMEKSDPMTTRSIAQNGFATPDIFRLTVRKPIRCSSQRMESLRCHFTVLVSLSTRIILIIQLYKKLFLSIVG